MSSLVKEPRGGIEGASDASGLHRSARGGTWQGDPGGTTALSRALRLARQKPGAATRVSDLADRAGLSPFQLDGRIRAMFGLSAGHYLTRLRIDHASEKLRTTAEPTSQVALDCGYADQFSRLVGLSPAAYRRAWAGGWAAPALRR